MVLVVAVFVATLVAIVFLPAMVDGVLLVMAVVVVMMAVVVIVPGGCLCSVWW